ncbi:DUF3488 and transglutaminase-like domain-containing protein [Actinoplanes derwentensis]|uniref:Transglutaminase-like superfamily protein n=1 Tax=Actinoplanes derwentensis TaxID=113562 RepID=A0A1H1VQE4_9ACTN|nr:transglutaminase domain-containing protein [Actinoplanes derwentensis]GID83616.1 hypothetical protein Ade03nite_25400 [Actinoplanes derwentensis]SDS87164.1 Transglutaminase-like superfamily protein [Actinoplanes derwentensis]
MTPALPLERVALAAGAGAAGLTWMPAFTSPARVALVVCVVAVLVGALLPRGWWAVPAALTGPVVAVLLGGVTGDLSLRFAESMVTGPSRALRLTLPLPAELLLVPALLTGVAAAAGAVLARQRPGSLVALVPAALAGAYGVLAAGLDATVLALLGAPQVIPAALGVGAAGLLLVAGRRRAGAPAGAVAAVVVVLVVAVPLLGLLRVAPGGADPRDRFRTAARLTAGVDVIDQVGGWLSAPDGEVLFKADAAPVPRWRLAVLDAYDGQTWQSTDLPVPAGLGVPPHHGPVPAGATTWTIELVALRGPYLPVVDRPIRVQAPVDAVGPQTGNLFTTHAVAAGTRYRTTALTGAFAARAAPVTAASRDVPADLAVAVRDFLGSVADSAPAPAVMAALRQGRRNVTGAPVSATATAVQGLLRQGGTGTTVQFATAFALAMRMRQVPARVVVGFAATTVVRSRDVQVWTELHQPGTGWVAYDPAPPPSPPDTPQPAPADPPPLAGDVAPSPDPAPSAVSSPRPAGPSTPWLWPWLWITLAVVALAVLALLLFRWSIPVIRRIWRRHRPGGPDARVAAAWREVFDACEPPPGTPRATITPARLHELLTDRLASAEPDGRTLRDLAGRALYSPQSCTPADVDIAWRAAGKVRRAITGAATSP